MLESTRDEVEAILGKPERFFQTSGYYITDIGHFTVWYSNGECKSDNEHQYLVPKGIATGLQFKPKTKEPLRNYAADISDFKDWKFDAIPDSVFWIRKDGSVSYETIKSGGRHLVFTIRLYPSEELHKKFACEAK